MQGLIRKQFKRVPTAQILVTSVEESGGPVGFPVKVIPKKTTIKMAETNSTPHQDYRLSLLDSLLPKQRLSVLLPHACLLLE
jgi:hypothetical protein